MAEDAARRKREAEALQRHLEEARVAEQQAKEQLYLISASVGGVCWRHAIVPMYSLLPAV